MAGKGKEGCEGRDERLEVEGMRREEKGKGKGGEKGWMREMRKVAHRLTQIPISTPGT